MPVISPRHKVLPSADLRTTRLERLDSPHHQHAPAPTNVTYPVRCTIAALQSPTIESAEVTSKISLFILSKDHSTNFLVENASRPHNPQPCADAHHAPNVHDGRALCGPRYAGHSGRGRVVGWVPIGGCEFVEEEFDKVSWGAAGQFRAEAFGGVDEAGVSLSVSSESCMGSWSWWMYGDAMRIEGLCALRGRLGDSARCVNWTLDPN